MELKFQRWLLARNDLLSSRIDVNSHELASDKMERKNVYTLGRTVCTIGMQFQKLNQVHANGKFEYPLNKTRNCANARWADKSALYVSPFCSKIKRGTRLTSNEIPPTACCITFA